MMYSRDIITRDAPSSGAKDVDGQARHFKVALKSSSESPEGSAGIMSFVILAGGSVCQAVHERMSQE